MKRFKNVDEALTLFEYYSKKGCEALDQYGDSKTYNRCAENIDKIIGYLKRNESVHLLERFHNHPNIAVRVEAAVLTLPLDEKKSLKVLKQVAKSDVRGTAHIEAVDTIKEWKNGNLKPFLIRLCTNQKVPEKRTKTNTFKWFIYKILINVGLVTCKNNQTQGK